MSKVNPIVEEKALLAPGQGNSNGPPAPSSKLGHGGPSGPISTTTTVNLQSLSRSRNSRREKKTNCNKILRKIVDGKQATVVMSAITLFALFGDDLRVWLTTKEADPYFYSGLIISFVLFSAEIFINSLVQHDFKYSFFFWLDIIATLSLIPDITWISDVIGLIVDSQPSYLSVNAIPGEMRVESATSSRIQKVVKALRLIRLVRIIKLYKYISQSNKTDKEGGEEEQKRKVTDDNTSTTEENEQQSLFMKETDPSKLGKALSDTTTRRVIIGVLMMLMVLPLLTYSEIDYSSEYALREIFWFGRSSCQSNTQDKKSIDFYCPKNGSWVTQEGWHEMLRGFLRASVADEQSELQREVVWLYLPDHNKQGRMSTIPFIPKTGFNTSYDAVWNQTDSCAGFDISDDCPYRYEEMELVTFTPFECLDKKIVGCDKLVAYCRFNKREEKVQEAILQFATTIFTCFVLTAASLIFSNDAERIVIKPIKKIILIIQRLAENPLKKPEPPKKDEEMEMSQMKTQMLELTIFKISTLLQRGFGELGAKIVANTLTNNEDFMDLMVPGQKIHMIYAVCRIKQFTETTESLQDEIIVFVNKIVKIIHEVAKKWDGQPAKNFGEKYLLIWKLPQNERIDGLQAAIDQNKALLGKNLRDFDSSVGNKTLEEQFNQTGKLPDVNAGLLQNVEDNDAIALEEQRKAKFEEELLEKRENIADKALISAVKIVVELRRAQDLQAYSKHPKISPKFPGMVYRTGVTVGLHVGWAIEGAIGSDFKIDALHLSPDAQIAHRIEEFCSLYDTTILLTQDLHKLLSEKGKYTLRLIDNVVMNESRTPRELYTFDIKFTDQIDNLPPAKLEEDLTLGGLIKHPDYDNTPTPEEFLKGEAVYHMFVIDYDFYTIRKQKKDKFDNDFRQAYFAYIQGDWSSSQNYLTSCLEMKVDDGPCLALAEYMDKHKNVVPDGWLGYRDLDEKDAAPSMSFIREGFDDGGGEGEDEEIEDDDSSS